MDNPLVFLLLGLLATWVGSYFFSLQYNRSKLRGLALWLKEALPVLGSQTSSRYHGSDRLDILIGQGRGNIREAAIVLGMQSRQLFRAVVSVLRGGRDTVSVLVSLHNPPLPGNDFEIYEVRGPLPRPVAIGLESSPPWVVYDYAPDPAYRIASPGVAGRDSARRALTLLRDDGFSVRRLSVRASAPHLFLILNLGGPPPVEAGPLLRLLKNLAEEVPLAPGGGSAGGGKARPAQSKQARRLSETKILSENYDTAQPGNHSSNGHKPHDL